MTVALAGLAGGSPGCGGVGVEYVDPVRGREREPLAACWASRFERMSPVGASGRSGASGTFRAGGGFPALVSSSAMSRGQNATLLWALDADPGGGSGRVAADVAALAW